MSSRSWQERIDRRWLLGFLLSFVHCVPMLGGEVKGYAGYTRPGLRVQATDGGIATAADDANVKRGGMGVSVYFMVFERENSGDDPWGTGFRQFSQRFEPGMNADGGASPLLDTNARYIYVYQVVNDRKTDIPIESMSVKLLVDLKEITSWGYFNSLFFTAPVANDPKFAAAGTINPVSFVNVVDGGSRRLDYRTPAPAMVADGVLRIGGAPLNAAIDKTRGAPVRLVREELDPARNPSYVQLADDLGRSPTFRALFSGKNLLTKGQRSVLFGFTSNLGPTMIAAKVRSTKETTQEIADIRFVGTEVDEVLRKGESIAVDGRVPTPEPENPTLVSAPEPEPEPEVAPETPPSLGPAPAVNKAPAAAPAASPGGPSGGGSAPGNGNGNSPPFPFPTPTGSPPQPQPRQANTNRQTNKQVNAPKVNVNVSQSVQVAQRNSSQQTQRSGSCSPQACGDPGSVHPTPEPATLGIAALALPCAYFFCRRSSAPSIRQAG